MGTSHGKTFWSSVCFLLLLLMELKDTKVAGMNQGKAIPLG